MKDAWEAVLRLHGRRYPRMEAQDAVKLAYQSEFGGGHLVTDEGVSLARLREESEAAARDGDCLPLEDIGNGLVRARLPSHFALETLNRAFIRSAICHRGSREGFLERLEVLRTLAGEGVFGFSREELETYLGPYLDAGCPPVSHSETYRQAYHPAYRVVLRRFLPEPLEEAWPSVCGEIEALEGAPALLAIDGRCGSGKTTLAERLRRRYGCPVVHMDHFFLRPEQRTEARYREEGGNIDYERFLEEVLLPLRRTGRAVYRPFHCGTMTLTEPVAIEKGSLVVIEGSYACHPSLRDQYDLRLFLTVSPAEQLRRVAARGDDPEVFRDRWIPLEERYFSACRVQECCQRQLET